MESGDSVRPQRARSSRRTEVDTQQIDKTVEEQITISPPTPTDIGSHNDRDDLFQAMGLVRHEMQEFMNSQRNIMQSSTESTDKLVQNLIQSSSETTDKLADKLAKEIVQVSQQTADVLIHDLMQNSNQISEKLAHDIMQNSNKTSEKLAHDIMQNNNQMSEKLAHDLMQNNNQMSEKLAQGIMKSNDNSTDKMVQSNASLLREFMQITKHTQSPESAPRSDHNNPNNVSGRSQPGIV